MQLSEKDPAQTPVSLLNEVSSSHLPIHWRRPYFLDVWERSLFPDMPRNSCLTIHPDFCSFWTTEALIWGFDDLLT